MCVEVMRHEHTVYDLKFKTTKTVQQKQKILLDKNRTICSVASDLGHF